MPTSTSLVASYAPGADRTGFAFWLGMEFTPTADVTYNKIGMRCATGNSGPYTVGVYSGPDQSTVIQSATVDLTGATVGNFYYTSMPGLKLSGGVPYFLYATYAPSDNWADTGPTALRNATGVVSAYTWASGPGTTTADQQYAGVDLDYVASTGGTVDLVGNFAV